MTFDKSPLYYIQSALVGERRSLFELATWKNGLPFKKIDFSATGLPIIKIAELNNGISANTSFTNGNYGKEVFVQWDDLLFSWSGNPQTSIDAFRYRLQNGWLNQHIFKVTPNDKLVSKDYMYYTLKNLKKYFTEIATNKQTTGLGHVTIADIKRISLIVPDKNIQYKIVSTIKCIDNIIEVNNAINDNLFKQAQILYRETFINCKHIPSTWHYGTASEVIILHDSRRIPLSSRDRAQRKKIYPYYGATSVMDYVDDYIFDGIYLLLAEDGTVIDKDGFPILQYVEGKFWVNNHAHIITGKSGYSVELLYILFSLTNVRHAVTGAVQPKISQANLKTIKILIPDKQCLQQFDKSIQPVFAEIRNRRTENACLATIRDELLPKLMSGELDVSNLDL